MIRTVPRSRWEGLPERDRGLSREEAAERRARFGANDVVEKAGGSWKRLARDTASDPMIWFLSAAGALFAALGERSDAWTLFAALVPLVAMDLWLHRRVHATTAGLESRLATRARVLRGDVAVEIPAIDVVPGDLVLVEAGGTFPADGLILEGTGLHADESALTGEAWPVPKSVLAGAVGTGEEDVRVDSAHWAFAGTRLLTGIAKIRILFTGRETLYGEIARAGAGDRQSRTPLQRSITRLVGSLVLGATAACIGLAAVRFAQGHGVVDALLSALSLAVAAMPEEFPVVFAVFLGVGVFRLARRRALVRRAAVVEGIGRITCICSDKTGTITEGKLRIVGEERPLGTTLERLKLVAATASPEEGADPLDDVLRGWASDGASIPLLARFPFTEGRRRETVVVRESPGILRVAVKGAPEAILPGTSLSATERSEWLRRVEIQAALGRKVIACASRSISERDWNGLEPATDLDFDGLVSCEDPIRPSAPDAVRTAATAGIRIILVTGDHPESARTVARRVGLGGGDPKVVAGDRLEERLADRRSPIDCDVVARALPRQKLDLVRALQARGEVVAVTGDGVNDVPALRAADVGIAMGGSGTQAARDAASIVLLEDDLSTITGAIAEGRQLFENLKRSFAYLLAIHVPFVASAALIPFLGLPLLYLPVHIVWLELVIHPTALLAFQQAVPGSTASGPRRGRAASFFDVREWIAIGSTGGLLAAFLIAAYFRALPAGADHARATALATMCAGSAALAGALSLFATRTATFLALATVLSSVVILQTKALADPLHVSRLDAGEWGMALAAGALSVLPLLARSETRRRIRDRLSASRFARRRRRTVHARTSAEARRNPRDAGNAARSA